jgi:hypothetical protein
VHGAHIPNSPACPTPEACSAPTALWLGAALPSTFFFQRLWRVAASFDWS